MCIDSKNPLDTGSTGESYRPRPLCPDCLRPCDPLAYYCPHCGSSSGVNPLTIYMPYVNIRFNAGLVGRLWGQDVSNPSRSATRRTMALLLAVWYFPPMALLAGWLWIWRRSVRGGRIWLLAAVAAVAVFAALGLWLLRRTDLPLGLTTVDLAE